MHILNVLLNNVNFKWLFDCAVIVFCFFPQHDTVFTHTSSHLYSISYISPTLYKNSHLKRHTVEHCHYESSAVCVIIRI